MRINVLCIFIVKQFQQLIHNNLQIKFPLELVEIHIFSLFIILHVIHFFIRIHLLIFLSKKRLPFERRKMSRAVRHVPVFLRFLCILFRVFANHKQEKHQRTELTFFMLPT